VSRYVNYRGAKTYFNRGVWWDGDVDEAWAEARKIVAAGRGRGSGSAAYKPPVCPDNSDLAVVLEKDPDPVNRQRWQDLRREHSIYSVWDAGNVCRLSEVQVSHRHLFHALR
jgi:hypothetical protein